MDNKIDYPHNFLQFSGNSPNFRNISNFSHFEHLIFKKTSIIEEFSVSNFIFAEIFNPV